MIVKIYFTYGGDGPNDTIAFKGEGNKEITKLCTEWFKSRGLNISKHCISSETLEE